MDYSHINSSCEVQKLLNNILKGGGDKVKDGEIKMECNPPPLCKALWE